MECDILRFLEDPGNGNFRAGFRTAKIPKGAILKNLEKDEPEIALMVSGDIRAYLVYADQEIKIITAERGFPILLASGLVLRARRDSEVLTAPRTTFLQFMVSTPELYWPMYLSVERLLAQTFRILEGIRFLNVRERLIRHIIDLAERSGQTMLDGTLIPFENTIEVVANDIGSSRQTTSQALNNLLKEGLIRRVSRTQLILPNITGLKKAFGDATLATDNLPPLALGTLDATTPMLCPHPTAGEKKGEDDVKMAG